MDRPDLLIAGAGPVGCVVAERAASQLGWSSVVVDRRPHLGGNCHDSLFDNGVLIHRYGPHYFRTNSDDLLSYLSRFTDWVPGNYVVKSLVGGKLLPFPINLTTLEEFFGRPLNEASARALVESVREKIASPRNSEELVLSKVGRELYEAFYLGYTSKQWGRHPRELDPSVCGRIPLRFNRDERYVDHKHQVMPALGFTALFSKMTSHRLIRVLPGCDYFRVRQELTPRRATLYTGPIDEYFGYRLGRLEWRALEFRHQAHEERWVQPCVQLNHPGEGEHTRTVEIKHVTRQEHPHTVVTHEYPRAQGEPCYPIPTGTNQALYRRYEELALRETRECGVYFAGRLARYRYLNTDEAIEMALQTFDAIARC